MHMHEAPFEFLSIQLANLGKEDLAIISLAIHREADPTPLGCEAEVSAMLYGISLAWFSIGRLTHSQLETLVEAVRRNATIS